MGNDLINQQINRQLPLMQSAQNASTNLAQGGGNLLQAIQNALATGQEGSAQALATGKIGEANARSAGAQNIIRLGTAAATGGASELAAGVTM